MKKKLFFITPLFIITVACFWLYQSCGSEGWCGFTLISGTGSTKSHNSGKNCMTCHTDGGEGKGCFTVAGSVYDSVQNKYAAEGEVKLYTGINGSGTLMTTIQVDGKGNFYTTANVNFMTPLYPSVASILGDTRHMQEGTTTGRCGSCHGISTAQIWVN